MIGFAIGMSVGGIIVALIMAAFITSARESREEDSVELTPVSVGLSELPGNVELLRTGTAR